MSADYAVTAFQSKYAIDLSKAKCDQFRLGMISAMFIKGEFNATAQIDPVEGGPKTINGATIFAGAASDDGKLMFIQASVGPPMNDAGGMDFAIPFAIGASTEEMKMTKPTKVIIVVAISTGAEEMCYLWGQVEVSPST